ncbi:hypothetical protein AaE_002718 [Aphanomyces astaci]|uniref:Uncharacterized protein n=1 Tax=Aphanomyces astaci TaxID=112090 RepID=A0A6A5AEY5_APHAT|nr:hypothetical protein AaE_002718 [Aphanomyces astaci]
MAKTVAKLRAIMNHLDVSTLEQYFVHEVEPFFVCDKVTVDVFNGYFGKGQPRIPLRCVELVEDRVLVVEYPISRVHESTKAEFSYMFLQSCGDGFAFGLKGSMTCHRPGHPDKEADATFAPLNSTPGRTPLPVLKDGSTRRLQDWITFAVEVGRYQSWASLERAAHWWFEYTGVQYVLLIKVSKRARAMAYRLYDVQDYDETNQVPPPAAAAATFRYQTHGAPVNVTLDNRRILSIPPTVNLPPGVNDTTVIDLRLVMRQVIDSI